MADYSYENIKIEKEDGITWLILNRPEKRNAMSPQLHYEADDALAKLETDPETKVLVLTGAGDEAFCAGQDLRLYFRGTADDPVERAKAAHASNSWRWRRLSTFPRPTIAMVNGYCFGGAFTPVCACDFAIAAEDAVFGLSEINWGILPGGIVSWNVADVMSYRDAIYYAVTGDTFDGKKAEEIRFVNYAVPKEKLREETIKLAEKLMAKNPVAVRFTKEAIRAVRHMSLDQAADYLRAKSDALKAADKEQGRNEGMKQFLDDKSYRPGFEPYKRQAG
ncbi:MAG: p-hydroxycinnamoyl CoA hydratase/lyase [Proteobacteria bacterium]|nr:p-hydroxycinnamoyl CoA hydratase/lyase [Pseudomonadota bacterium]